MDETKTLLQRRKELMDALNPLYKKYNELKASNAPVAEVNAVVNQINPLAIEVKEIDRRLIALKNAEQDTHVVVSRDNSKKKHLTKGGIVCLVAGVLAVGIGGTLLLENSCRKNCSGKCASDEKSVSQEVNGMTLSSDREINGAVFDTKTSKPTATPTAAPTATPVPTPTPVLVDINNEEDIEKAVDRIYDQDVNQMIEGNPTLADQVSREDFVDILRFVNGELPLNRTYGSTTFDELANKFIYVYGGQGSNELYPEHYANLCKDNSTLKKYCESYDVIYNRIYQYLEEGNIDGFIEEVGVLGAKMHNEWHLFGMNGGYNPYTFSKEERFLAFNAAFGRFAKFVKGPMMTYDLTICTDACINIDKDGNKTYKKVEVRDIYEAALYGTSKNKEISIIVGSDVFNPNEMASQSLQEVLKEKSEAVSKVLK